MLDLLKKDLTDNGVFNGDLPDVLKKIVDAIPNQKIPYRMKLTIAVSELVHLASHLRRNIKHWNGSAIPINAITFAIAGSGSGKDSSINAARKCFAKGYKIIETKRLDIAKYNAISAAMKAGDTDPSEWNTYKEYYTKPDDLFTSPDSTIKGLVKHYNALEESGIGAGYVYSGEIGSEMAAGAKDLMRFMAEIYDEGSKEVKLIGDKAEQLKPITNLPVSALFMGSEKDLLFDDTIKSLFKREFSTKLARRSFFMFFSGDVPKREYTSIEAMRIAKRKMEDDAVEARHEVDEFVSGLVHDAVSKAGRPLEISEEVRDLFNTYQEYNDEMSQTIKAQYPISKLVREHLQWKALKLAGAIAIFEQHDEITKSDYVSAISFVEMLDKDMQAFEVELVKEPYEIFVDYMHSMAENGKSRLGLHALRKLGYIPTSGVSAPKMKELATLAASYDETGIYTVCEEGICYEEILITDTTGISFLPSTGTKEERRTTCASGYTYDPDCSFADFGEILEGDFAYSPFQFTDGVRGKESVVGGCKWLFLDIDTSLITDEECHFILQDINHHIARTSNPDNAFKFRVLLELDGVVDIPDIQWKYFVSSIAESLQLTHDPVPKSQIAFSYAGRKVLSVTDASPIEVKEHVMVAATAEPRKEVKKVPPAEAKRLLADEFDTFSFAFEAASGQRSREIIRAAYYARDLGMPNDEIIELVSRINSKLDESLPETELNNTIISQIRRF